MSATNLEISAHPPLKIVCLGLSDPQWPKRMKRICRAYNAEVIYWVSMKKRRNGVKEVFPQALFHNMARAICGVAPPELLKQKNFTMLPPDAPVLEAMSPYQATAMKMMDRMDPDLRSFTYEERLRHYYRQVAFWYSTLKYLSPDLVFFPITPHANYDYIIYGLCKHLGIQTLMLDRTAIPSRVLMGSTIRETSEALAAQYRLAQAHHAGENVVLPPYVEAYFDKLQGDYKQALPPNIVKKMERMRITTPNIVKDGFWKCLRYEVSGLYRHLNKTRPSLRELRSKPAKHLRSMLRLTDSYLKEPFRTPEASVYNALDEIRARVLGKRIKNSLRNYYFKHQKTPDLSHPYVFVALHYQPERNTIPIGEWFGDQLLMIQLLSHSLPKGWMIYVKEHGQQWSYFSKGERGRTIALYKDILKLGNTTLVPIDIPSFTLIDHARATATVAGSAGWESIARGKPAFVFGNAWYVGCHGALHIQTRAECASAMDAVASGFVPDKNLVRLFLKTLDEHSIHTVIDTIREDRGDLSPRNVIENFVYGFGIKLAALFPTRIEKPLAPSYDAHDPILAHNVMMLSETTTVLQEFVSLAEKCIDDRRLHPIIAMNAKLLESAIFSTTPYDIETLRLKRGGNAKWRNKEKLSKYPRAIRGWIYQSEQMFYYGIIYLNRVLPAPIRDRLLLGLNLDLLEGKAIEILRQKNIKALILPDDRVIGYNISWLNAARKLGIFTCVVPFGISHPEGGGYMRRERWEHHIDKGSAQRAKQKFAAKYPAQLYTSHFGKILFYKMKIAKILERRGMLPPIPWISGGGHSDKVFALASEDANLLREMGVTTKEIEIVGQCALDYLWEAKEAKTLVAAQIREKYALDAYKPILIFAIPHLAEHKICSWEVHEAKLRPLLAMLKDQQEVTVLLSAHPRGKFSFYKELAEEYGLALMTEQLSRILPIAHIFMATHSSTVRWAAIMGTPSVILNYDIGHTFLDNFKGNTVFNEEHVTEIRDHIARLVHDTVFYARQKQQLLESVGVDLHTFDGNARLRIIEGILNKINDVDVKDMSNEPPSYAEAS